MTKIGKTERILIEVFKELQENPNSKIWVNDKFLRQRILAVYPQTNVEIVKNFAAENQRKTT